MQKEKSIIVNKKQRLNITVLHRLCLTKSKYDYYKNKNS